MRSNIKILVYKSLLTVAVFGALMCNVLPFMQVENFGYSTSISVLDCFDSEYLSLFLDVGGQSDVFSIIKALILSIMAFDALTGLFCWLVKSKWISLLGVLAGLLQTGCWGVLVVLAYRSSEMQDLMSMGLEFGIGVWGFIITGIIINILSITLLFGDEGEEEPVGQYVTKEEGSLLGTQGIYAGAKIPVGTNPVVMGRDNTGCHVIIPGEKISRQHCSVSYDSRRKIYTVWDLSSNGVFLADGRRIATGSANELRAGCKIRIGDRDEFEFQ